MRHPLYLAIVIALVGAAVAFSQSYDSTRLSAERLVQRHERVFLAPDGRHGLVGSGCRQMSSPHGPEACEWRLVRSEDDRVAPWTAKAVGASWSANGERFVFEQEDHATLLGGVREPPRSLRLLDRLTAPALSPDGSLVAGQILGAGDDHFAQLETSPGIGVYLASTGHRVDLLEAESGYKFAAFFVSATELLYGEVARPDLGIVAVFAWNRLTGARRQLTNLDVADTTTFPADFALMSGRSVVLVQPDESGQVYIETLDVDTTERRRIGLGKHAVLSGGRIHVVREER